MNQIELLLAQLKEGIQDFDEWKRGVLEIVEAVNKEIPEEYGRKIICTSYNNDRPASGTFAFSIGQGPQQGVVVHNVILRYNKQGMTLEQCIQACLAEIRKICLGE